MTAAKPPPRVSFPAVVAVVARPRLWLTAVVELVRLAPAGWWRRRPFLPRPDPGYLRFRMQTMYGDAGHDPEPADLVTWLEWCRSFRKVSR
jgi:hypothetical protein